VAKKTLRQFVESNRHAYESRLIVSADKHMIEKSDDECEFIAWVHIARKDSCERLQRKGRDSLTTIFVKEVWNEDQVKEYFSRLEKEIPKPLTEAMQKSPGKLCFCKCNMKIRKADIGGMPR
tara:strand:+ start:1451 stop:1816 length:366 start_codon:yes stop_codon:yes gene_type:complete